MKRFMRTNLGNALAYGAATFGILVSIAGTLWVIGRLTGGN